MLILVALLALAAPDAAPAAPAPAAQAAAPAPGKKDESLVCITKAKVGTRFKERVCMDKAEYARRQDEERKAIDRMQRIPHQGN
jgi:hypothetical protein